MPYIGLTVVYIHAVRARQLESKAQLIKNVVPESNSTEGLHILVAFLNTVVALIKLSCIK